MKKGILIIVSCFLITANSFAENEFSLNVAPLIKAPLAQEYMSPGFGVLAALDWAFWPFSNNFNMGVRAGVNYASIPVEVGDPLSLLEGKTGPFVRWQPRNQTGSLDRWSFQTGLDIGLYQYSRGEDSETKALASFNLGGEFRLSPYISLFAETGYTYRVFNPPETLSTIDAAIGFRLNLSTIMSSKSRLHVEKTKQFRVFPVSWAWYEKNPIAMITVTNEEPNTITDVNISFYMESYMSEPWHFATLPRIGPGESVEVPLTALFNEAMLNLTENTNAAGSILTQYRSLGSTKESLTVVQMPIFHRNAFSWEDDRRAAAFVSPRDSSALHFARYIAGVVESQAYTGNIPANVRYAVAMFEALNLYGINYVVVPATSYKNISGNEAVLDSVSYPYQALYYRGGDCTYLSILFCSLLEALKIETSFITIPGHLYIAFEVGDSKWRAGSSDIIEKDGKRWLPVEITVPAQGFLNAWRIGARQWRTNGAKSALYPIRDAWELYPSVTVPASGDHLPEVPEQADIVRALDNQLLSIR